MLLINCHRDASPSETAYVGTEPHDESDVFTMNLPSDSSQIEWIIFTKNFHENGDIFRVLYRKRKFIIGFVFLVG